MKMRTMIIKLKKNSVFDQEPSSLNYSMDGVPIAACCVGRDRRVTHLRLSVLKLHQSRRHQNQHLSEIDLIAAILSAFPAGHNLPT
jgi:hypothetical protein